MQSLNIKTYLLYSIYIVRTNPAILLFLTLIGFLNGVSYYMPKSSFADLVGTLTFISTIFISPVIYGIYYEIIEEKYSSIANIFRTYVPGYLFLLFAMYIPIVTITAILMSSSGLGGNMAYVMLTILIFSLLFLYVVPTYYISGKILDSIVTGVRFLLSNLISSAPVLLMALSSELLLLLSHYKLGWLKENHLSLFVFMDFSVYMMASIIDFLLFIILVYILKNQPAATREV